MHNSRMKPVPEMTKGLQAFSNASGAKPNKSGPKKTGVSSER